MIFEDGVWVADVIMGGGKTSSIINYINSSGDDERFIYMTPYEKEFERIAEACSQKGFVVPVVKRGAKLNDLRGILKKGINVATSHAIFERYTSDMIEFVQNNNYTLVIDEAYSVTRMISPDDIKQAIWYIEQNQAYVDQNSHQVMWNYGKGEPSGSKKDISQKIIDGRLYSYEDHLMVWQLPPSMIKAFKTIIVLTYLFDAQELKFFFDQHEVSYNYVGTKLDDYGEYCFCSVEESENPTNRFANKIHILDNIKLNAIGDSPTSLTSTWASNDANYNKEGGLQQLGKNVRNVQKNIFRCSSKDFIWTAYDTKARHFIEDKNIKKGFVVWNKRATNDYGDRHYLAYTINLRCNPSLKRYFDALGADYAEDRWALAHLVQWIWRSAIRNGEEIWIYIPSRRMRTLLTDWIEEVSGGGSAG